MLPPRMQCLPAAFSTWWIMAQVVDLPAQTLTLRVKVGALLVRSVKISRCCHLILVEAEDDVFSLGNAISLLRLLGPELLHQRLKSRRSILKLVAVELHLVQGAQCFLKCFRLRWFQRCGA